MRTIVLTVASAANRQPMTILLETIQSRLQLEKITATARMWIRNLQQDTTTPMPQVDKNPPRNMTIDTIGNPVNHQQGFFLICQMSLQTVCEFFIKILHIH